MLDTVTLLDHGVYINGESVLVFADLHLGFGQALHNKGVTLPKSQYGSIKRIIKSMIAEVKPKKIIIAGDLKHEFSTNLGQEWKQARDALLFLKHNCEELVLIRGNHDNFLASMVSKWDLTIQDAYETSEFMIVHGHEKTRTRKTIIMGHEHPALILKDGAGATHKYKCHLVGDNIIVLPSLNALTIGYDVLSGDKPLSPLLRGVRNLRPVVNNLIFPEVKELMKYVH